MSHFDWQSALAHHWWLKVVVVSILTLALHFLLASA